MNINRAAHHARNLCLPGNVLDAEALMDFLTKHDVRFENVWPVFHDHLGNAWIILRCTVKHHNALAYVA